MRPTELATKETNNSINSNENDIKGHKEQEENNQNTELSDEIIQQIIFSKIRHYKSNEKYTDDITLLDLSNLRPDILSLILTHLALNIKSKYSNITDIILFNSKTSDLPRNIAIWDTISDSGNIRHINFGLNKLDANEIIFINVLKIYYPNIKYTYLPQDLFLPEFLYSIKQFNILLGNLIDDAQQYSFWNDAKINALNYTENKKQIIVKSRLDSIKKAILMALAYNLPLEIKEKIESNNVIIDKHASKILINEEYTDQLYETLRDKFNLQKPKARTKYIIKYAEISLNKFVKKEHARVDKMNNEAIEQINTSRQIEAYNLLDDALISVNTTNSLNKRGSYDKRDSDSESNNRKHPKFR